MSQMNRCRWRCGRFFWTLFPHLCLVTCLILYTFAGAPLFQYLENSAGGPKSKAEILLEELWNVSQSVHGNASADEESFKNLSRPLIAPYVKAEGNWTFLSSLFFCCTVVTTVGYGNLTPSTVPGRAVFMVYAAVGIPLMLLVLADLGGILAFFLSETYNYLRDAWHRCRSEHQSKAPNQFSTFPRRSDKSISTQSTLDSCLSMKEPLNLTEIVKSQATVKRRVMQMHNIDIFDLIISKENRSELLTKSPLKRCHSCPDLEPNPTSVVFNFDHIGGEVDHLHVPIPLIILIVMAYIMLGAIILPLWEDWDTLEAFYFCFVTLTTIGFGDVFPAHPNYFLLLSLYTVVGMAIICMAFKLMQNRMVCMYKQCIICISGGNVQ